MQEWLIREKQFDPFRTPPNLKQAELHRNAVSVGVQTQEDQQICPCCNKFANKKPVPLCQSDQNLQFLGMGFLILFKLTRYIAVILLVYLLTSGVFYYLYIIKNCQDNCLTYLGIPLINLNVSMIEMEILQPVNIVTSIFICLAVIYIQRSLSQKIEKCQKSQKVISDYAILLQNFPNDIHQNEINDWVFQTFKVYPVMIDLAYDVQIFKQYFQERQRLTIKHKQLLIRLQSNQQEPQVIKNIKEQILVYQKQIEEKDKVLNQFQQAEIVCEKLGTVFLTFEDPEVVRKIIQKYEQSGIKTIFKDILQPFYRQNLQYKHRIIIVKSAPQPKQVIWQNLSYSCFRNLTFWVAFLSFTVFFLFIGFEAQINCLLFLEASNYFQYFAPKDKQIIFSLALCLIVIVLNNVLNLLIIVFIKFRKYESVTSQESTYCLYSSIFYLFNSCLTLYVIHNRNIKNYAERLILKDIHLIIIGNAFSQPIIKIINPFMWWKLFWKSYIKRMQRQKIPYPQSYVNKLWEGQVFTISTSYQYLARMSFINIWFAHSAPIAIILSLLGFLLDYWLSKYLLFNYYKMPEITTKKILFPFITLLSFLPYVYICGVLAYNYTVMNYQSIQTLFYRSYGYFIAILVIMIIQYCGNKYSRQKNWAIKQPYSKMMLYFDSNYETQNPKTKIKGQLNYSEKLLKIPKSNFKKLFLNEINELKRYQGKQIQINITKIKQQRRKIVKKISSISLSEKSQRSQSRKKGKSGFYPNL